MNKILFLSISLFILAGFIFVPGTLASDAPNGQESDSAVVFVYHRVGQEHFTRSNLSLDMFQQHVELISREKYNVLPLSEIMSHIQNGEALPRNTIAITFEGAYAATLENALPLLLENELPFTLFFSAARIDRGAPQYMTWKDLRRLKRNQLVSFGLLPAEYIHLVHQDHERVHNEINTALSRVEKELDLRPQFFAYPFGEYSKALQKKLASYNFTAVFGQHSGPIDKNSDLLALPRFSLTEEFAGIERFELTARTLPLPLTDITPEDAYIPEGEPPHIGFTISNLPAADLERLACFVSEIGEIDLIRIEGQRFEIRFEQPLPPGRLRINCTLPYENVQPGEAPRWYWHGMMFTIGNANAPDSGEEF